MFQCRTASITMTSLIAFQEANCESVVSRAFYEFLRNPQHQKLPAISRSLWPSRQASTVAGINMMLLLANHLMVDPTSDGVCNISNLSLSGLPQACLTSTQVSMSDRLFSSPQCLVSTLANLIIYPDVRRMLVSWIYTCLGVSAPVHRHAISCATAAPQKNLWEDIYMPDSCSVVVSCQPREEKSSSSSAPG